MLYLLFSLSIYFRIYLHTHTHTPTLVYYYYSPWKVFKYYWIYIFSLFKIYISYCLYWGIILSQVELIGNEVMLLLVSQGNTLSLNYWSLFIYIIFIIIIIITSYSFCSFLFLIHMYKTRSTNKLKSRVPCVFPLPPYFDLYIFLLFSPYSWDRNIKSAGYLLGKSHRAHFIRAIAMYIVLNEVMR